MKCRIWTEPVFEGFSFLFYTEENGKRRVVKPVDLIIEEHKDHTVIAPTMRMPSVQGYEFLKSIVEEINRLGLDFNIDKLEKIEGELKATKFHLEDMRTLVFEPVINKQA